MALSTNHNQKGTSNMLTVINPDGTYSGVQYTENKAEYIAHHAQYGQICIWDARPLPTPDEKMQFSVHPEFGTPAFDLLKPKRFLSKLTLLRRLKALGKAETGIAMLKADPIMYEEWSAAQDIDVDDVDVNFMLNALGVDVQAVLAE
jgi:hypothetical protein